MFIQTEATPNPATLKFLPGRVVMPEGTFEARDRRERCGVSPLGQRLFAIPGVDRCVLRPRFRDRDQSGQRVAAPQAGHPRRDHGAFHDRCAAVRTAGAT